MSLSPVQSRPDPTSAGSLKNQYLVWFFTFFVLSGFCGLVYEVVWVRLAMAAFGVTTALVSIVLSIFMAGLGLGSWGAGILMRKSSGLLAARTLRIYAGAEFLIGCSAVCVPVEFQLGRELMLHTGGLGAWQSWHYYVLAGAWLFIALLPWCTLLGATFPLLMAVIKQTCPQASERSFSYLYVANVLGALVGTLVSAVVLIELFGFRRTLLIAAGLNALVALLASWISTRRLESHGAGAPTIRSGDRPRLYGLPRATVPLMLFTTGLVSMGSEVVWMREYTPYLGNFVYAFAIIVAVYLVATFMGARDYRRWAMKHRAGESSRIWALLAISTLLPAVGANPLLPFDLPGLGGLRIISIFLFCALTGFLTPLLVDSWSSGEPDKAGSAYAFNVAGCIVGPLFASFALGPWIGERWSLLVFSIPLFAIAGILAFRTSDDATEGRPARSRTLFVGVLATAVVVSFFTDDYETRFVNREVRRDYSATVVATGTGFDRKLMVNGAGMTSLNPITKYIPHLPLAMMKEKPRNGLVICFGMGTSFRSMLSWGIPTTAVDLIPSVPKMFPYFHADARQVESSPLAKIVVDDGRRFLDGANEKYDVIVVDPPPPVEAPGSSLLYSREFYEVIKRHLSDEGIFQSWYPAAGADDASTASIAKTLLQAFPYVRAFRSYDHAFGIHFLASMHPLPVEEGAALAAHMPLSAASDFVEWGPEANAAKEFDLVLSSEVPLQRLVQKDPMVPVLTDDQPINEYFALRILFNTSR